MLLQTNLHINNNKNYLEFHHESSHEDMIYIEKAARA